MESFKNWLDNLQLDFVGWRRPATILSAVLVLASWFVFFAIGPNWGIDFTGGTEIHLRFDDPVEIGEVRSALRTLGLSDDAVQEVGTDEEYEFAIRIQDPTFGMSELVESIENKLVETYGADWLQESVVSAEVGARITMDYAGPEVQPQAVQQVLTEALIEGVTVQPGRSENQLIITVPGLSQLIEAEIAEAVGGRTFQVMSIDAVGPKVGGDLRRQGFLSIGATLGLVLLYVAFRFDLNFAPGAILALIHDVSITVGIFTVLQLEFSLPMIGALLTIVGYSLNDTIVIYDRIRENFDKYRRKETAEMINISINETMTRTFATSFTTLLAISPFLILGSPVIQNFALAMFIGIIFGTYSTVYVASPMILLMEDVKPYLSRFMATPGGDAGGGDVDSGPPVEGADMTESEKRRRERAEAERRESTT